MDEFNRNPHINQIVTLLYKREIWRLDIFSIRNYYEIEESEIEKKIEISQVSNAIVNLEWNVDFISTIGN